MKHEKVAPGLMVAYEQFRAREDAAVAPLKRTLGFVHSAGMPKPARTVVFIDCDARANLDHLAQHDIRVNQPKGSIRTAILPLTALDPLSDDNAVKRITPARYLHPRMDVAAGAAHVTQFRVARNRSGNGVIVGIIDTGIDSSHPAFDGRILQTGIIIFWWISRADRERLLPPAYGSFACAILQRLTSNWTYGRLTTSRRLLCHLPDAA